MNPIKIEQATEDDKCTKIVYVEAVLLQNGEIIRNGKTIQMLKDGEEMKGIYHEVKGDKDKNE